MVITQSLLHVGELCEGTTVGNEGSGRSWRVGKEVATCVAVVGDGMVGMGFMAGWRNGDMRCSGGGWDGWDGLYGRLEEGAGEIYCMNSFTAE